jgi:hypothetical protein
MVLNTTPTPAQAPRPDSLQSDLAGLAELLEAHAPYDGVFDLPLPGVHATRASRTNKDFHHAVQRAKRVLLGQERFEYDASRMLVSSVDVPVAAQVTEATLARPFLGQRVDLDPARIASLTAKVFPHGLPRRGGEGKAICVDQADAQGHPPAAAGSRNRGADLGRVMSAGPTH